MIISIYNSQKDLKISKKQTRLLVCSVLSFLKIFPQEMALYFVSKKKISELHLQFFSDPSPTDCMTFPLDENFLGEVFICPQVAIEYAEQRGLDPYEETSLYIIHGLLHLIGYTDLEKKEREKMRKKEKSCMRHLKKNKICLQCP